MHAKNDINSKKVTLMHKKSHTPTYERIQNKNIRKIRTGNALFS